MSEIAVAVTPLEPPFDRAVTFFSFEGSEKILAVSLEDGERVQALLNGQFVGRRVVLSRADDGERILISLTRQ